MWHAPCKLLAPSVERAQNGAEKNAFHEHFLSAIQRIISPTSTSTLCSSHHYYSERLRKIGKNSDLFADLHVQTMAMKQNAELTQRGYRLWSYLWYLWTISSYTFETL